MPKISPAMTRHVRNVWGPEQLPELIEAAEAVERLADSPGWKAVQRVLDAEVATIDREMDNGAAKEAADYAKQHGRRSALRASVEAAGAIIGEAVRRREQAEQAQEEEDAGESASERMAA
jgi:hypothetical protein